MSSIEDWEHQYADVLQRGDPDPRAARNKLDLGERNVVRARRDLDAGDPDSALLMARRMRSQAMYDVFGLVSDEQANAVTDAAEKLLGAVRKTFTT